MVSMLHNCTLPLLKKAVREVDRRGAEGNRVVEVDVAEYTWEDAGRMGTGERNLSRANCCDKKLLNERTNTRQESIYLFQHTVQCVTKVPGFICIWTGWRLTHF